MSVRQLMAYHSLVLLHKAPQYMYDKVTAGGDFAYKTRQAAACPEGFSFSVQHPTDIGAVRQVPGNKLGISKQGWCWRSVDQYKKLPTSIRLEKQMTKFKKNLKIWVELNINI